MSCSSPTRELVTFFVAGTLTRDEAAAVSRHLDTCVECRTDVSDGRLVIEGLRELHLSADEVVAAAAGDLNAPHLLVCSRCRDEVALLRTINADLTKTSGWSRRRWWPVGLTALAAAAAIFVLWVAPRRPVDEQTTRSGNAPAVVELLPATTAADGVPTFVWRPFPGATRYRVELFSEDGRSVWTREVDAPPLRWPDDKVPRMKGAYRWRVEALNDGVVVARSRLADLEIAR